jgi:hypothetical protein
MLPILLSALLVQMPHVVHLLTRGDRILAKGSHQEELLVLEDVGRTQVVIHEQFLLQRRINLRWELEGIHCGGQLLDLLLGYHRLPVWMIKVLYSLDKWWNLVREVLAELYFIFFY